MRISDWSSDVCSSDLRARYPGVESMNVAVMGCVVNGPGESRHADIGISLPGTGEVPAAPVFVDGERTVTLKGERIAEEFQIIDRKSAVEGKSMSVRVDLGCGRILKKKNTNTQH